MSKIIDSKIALVTQNLGEVTSYNAAGEVLGNLQKNVLVHCYSSKYIVLANLDNFRTSNLFELRNQNLRNIKSIKDTDILNYLTEDVIHFPFFVHLDPLIELENLKQSNSNDDEPYRTLKSVCHSFDRYILKIAKENHISYIIFRNQIQNKHIILNELHEKLKQFLEKNRMLDFKELKSKSEKLIEIELIGLKNI